MTINATTFLRVLHCCIYHPHQNKMTAATIRQLLTGITWPYPELGCPYHRGNLFLEVSDIAS